MAQYWENENGNQLHWGDCYVNLNTHTKKECYKHLLSYKYQMTISIHDRDLTSLGASEIEDWCREYIGKLDEFDGNSKWQVTYACKNQTENLVFLFKNEDDAALFKLVWC